MEQQDVPQAEQALPDAETVQAEMPATMPGPPAERIDWAARAERLKALTIKSAKIMSIVAAGIALVELIYAGVLILL